MNGPATTQKLQGYFSRFGSSHCNAIINNLRGSSQLLAKLAAAANLTLRQASNVRLGDLDLHQGLLIVRKADDKKNGATNRKASGETKFICEIPAYLLLDLRIQNIKVHSLIQQQKEALLVEGYSELEILANQLEPEWQYLFPYTLKDKNGQAISYLNQTPLALLRNDIRIALKQHLRFWRGRKTLNSKTQAYQPKRATVKKLNIPNSIGATSNKRFNPQACFTFEQEQGAA